MSLDKQKNLVSLLLKKTYAGKLDWKPSVDDGSFQVSFAKYSVRISIKLKLEEDDFAIEIIDASGTVIDAFTDFELITSKAPDDETNWYRVMKELYEIARRTALGSEQALSSILDELEDDDPDEIPF
jgi:hypothetical protein